jgi:sugar phosphate permease
LSTPEATDAGDSEAPPDSERVRWERWILVGMYVGYAAMMICRNTLQTSSAAMIEDPTLGLDKAAYGRLMSWHSAGAIFGKLVTGIGADALGGRRMFLLSVALTGLTTMGFAMARSYHAFAALNFFGQAAKAGGWPAMAKLVPAWYSPKRYGQIWSIISTSSRVGTVTAGLLLGYLLTFCRWQTVFLVSGAIGLVAAGLCAARLANSPEDVGLAPPEPDEEAEDQPAGPHRLDGTTLPQACWVFAASARFWLICVAMALLTVMMDFINFIPVYLSETLEISAGGAGMAGSVFPASMFVALLASSAFYDRFRKPQLVKVLGGMLGISCLCVVGLWALPHLGLPEAARLPAALVLLFVFGFTLSPSYYIPMSLFAVAFGGPHGGFLVALLDVFGYLGAMTFNYFGGAIAQKHGWPVFLGVLLTVTVIATVSMTWFLHLDAVAARKQEAREAAGS